MLSIGELAKITGLTTRAIRHYHQIGLLDCEFQGGVRRFKEESVDDLYAIYRLKNLGFGLEEIGILLKKTLRPTTDFKPILSQSDRPKIYIKLQELYETLIKLDQYLKSRGL